MQQNVAFLNELLYNIIRKVKGEKVMDKKHIKCIDCKYCISEGRANKTYRVQYPRKIYKCQHPNLQEIKDRYGFPINGHIGFGNTTLKSPLQFKSYKKFCPLEDGYDE